MYALRAFYLCFFKDGSAVNCTREHYLATELLSLKASLNLSFTTSKQSQTVPEEEPIYAVFIAH